ncbi:MAG: hypothetical protein C0501_23015 [Isosphaera sp.]|nr:hypothetical protein [Isosphaera sp.]
MPDTPAVNLRLAREGRPSVPVRAWRGARAFGRGLFRLVGTLFTIGFSLLPLAALLVALPAVAPNEAVLSETVRPARSRLRRTARRVLAAAAGVVVLVILLAFSVEVVARLPLPSGGQLGTLARKVLGASAVEFVPFAFPEDPSPASDGPLKEMLAARERVRKDLTDRADATPAEQLPRLAELAGVNAAIADWADQPEYRWMVPGALLAERSAADAASADEAARGRRAKADAAVADRVAEVTGRWLPAADLLDRRDVLRKAAARPNLDPRDLTDARAKLAEVEAEVLARTPNSVRLRVTQDPDLAPVLAVPLWKLLPPPLVDQWPFVFLVMYATDLGLLLLIGKVPLAYNFRYLWVRKRDTALTALAFTVVVALVVVLLSFVNGMYKLNEGTGVPGNVLVLSEGSTDELFSNLTRGDGQNVEREAVTADRDGRPVGPGGKGVGVARGVVGPGGVLTRLPADAPKDLPGAVYLASYEAYLVMNQEVPQKPGEPARRRFLQVRAFQDVRVGAAVHAIDLDPGGVWFNENAVDPGPKAPDGLEYLQCCVGEGSAGTLGEDVGKPRLAAGDTFKLGDRFWKVTGVMRTRGTAYGSELWTSSRNQVVDKAGKADKFTTLVLRMADDGADTAKAMAWYLNEGYTQAKLKAFAEPDYYAELTKTNEQFLTAIVLVAVIMAVGGVFGVMNTMFASIAARIREVGVLRVLGFKRWQILISFMLESLAIGAVGGVLGCLLGLAADGWEAASTLSGGQGGGKSVTLTMSVDYQILAAGMLFTLVMGRLGGLVPALSAMRTEILDSLR